MQKRPQKELFLESLKELYGSRYPDVIKGMKDVVPSTFRINHIRTQDEPVLTSLRNLGFVITKGPLENSFYVQREPKDTTLSRTDSFNTGQIYMQEFSSMIPPIVLSPKSGEKVLDMASAPGSKTSQMADMMENSGEIVALEKHPIRIQQLQHNLLLQGVENTTVIQGNGIKYDRRHPEFTEYFDKVLVDAPCSSEGRFDLDNPKTFGYWNIHKRKDLSRTQKGLLIAGIRMLKPGGTLVYSTCTFGIEENELVLDWLLEKYTELEIEPINLSIQNVMRGLITWKEKPLNQKIRNAIRILPSNLFSGFFVAKITKPASNSNNTTS